MVCGRNGNLKEAEEIGVKIGNGGNRRNERKLREMKYHRNDLRAIGENRKWRKSAASAAKWRR
jgi:hypothetical protein